MSQGAFFQQADGCMTDINPAALEMFGLTRDECLARTSEHQQWYVIDEIGSPLPPEKHPSMVALLTGQAVRNCVVAVFNPERDCYVWMNVNATPLFNGGESPEQVFVTLDDISEQKHLDDIYEARNFLLMFAIKHSFEELLVATVNELEKLTNSKKAFYYLYDQQSDIFELKARSTKTVLETGHPDDVDTDHSPLKTKALADCVRTKGPIIYNVFSPLGQQQTTTPHERELTIPIIRNDRVVAILRGCNKSHNYNQNDIEAAKLFADLAWDIAEHKRVQRQIRRSQAQLRFLADQLPVLIAQMNRDAHYKFVNKPYAEFYGLHPAAIIGKHPREVAGDEAYEAIKPYVEAVLSGETVEFEVTLQSQQKQEKTFHARYVPEKNKQDSVVGFFVALMDISSRIQAEAELLNNQYYLGKAQEIGKIGTWELDIINNILIWTDENCRIFGVPEGTQADYQLFLSRVHPDDRGYVNQEWQEAMQGKPYDIEHRLLIDGEVSWVREKADVTFSPAGKAISAIGFTQDVTERTLNRQAKERLEADLQQARKLEALGTMAGGIAHNFNNNLAIILGNLELAKLKSTASAEVEKYFDSANKAILRSRDLVKQILIYSRQGIGEKKIVKVVGILDETFRLLKSSYPSTVNLTLHIPKQTESVFVKAEEARIQEALINLCNNAVHAMNEVGELEIKLDQIEVKAGEIPKTYLCEPGSYVRISVCDTGCGIADDMIGKIFDPFFTTKDMSQGTGMGLSTVRGIIDAHEGFIKVKSKINEGSTFDLYLPIAENSAAESSEPKEFAPVHGSGHILFIDDEKMLAELGKVMLEEMGYQVTCQTDPQEALKSVSEKPGAFDLVITDQTMPGLTGKELAQKIKQIRPDLPIILCTGHSSLIATESAEEIGVDMLCLKPLRMSELGVNVRRCLSPHS